MSDDLVPHTARRGGFVPTDGSGLVVDLDNELIECAVVKRVGDNGVIVFIVSRPTRRVPQFKCGEQIAARRSVNGIGQEVWVGMHEATLAAAVEQERAERAAATIGEVG
jgi:hypothetical protein